MQLRNDFRVGVPAETAWQILNDVERIAPCLPGAQLQEIEGGEYRGIVKVKVGPITAQYKGRATFVEQDEARGRVVLRATGRDTGGGGNANATITATMAPDGDGTKVMVVTDLAVTGKLAQLGRGVLSEVSTKLLGQFVDCLEHNVLAPETRPGPIVPSEPAAAYDCAPSPGDFEAAPESAGAPGSKPAASTASAPEPASEPAAQTEVAPESEAAASTASAPEPASEPAAQTEVAPGSKPAASTASAPEPASEPAVQTEVAPGSKPAVEGTASGAADSAGAAASEGPSTLGAGAGEAPGDASTDGGSAAPEAPRVRRVEGPEVEPVDLLDAAKSSVAKRALPSLAAIIALVLAIVVWRRRHRN